MGHVPNRRLLQSDAALLVLGRLRSAEKSEVRGPFAEQRPELNRVLSGKLRSAGQSNRDQTNELTPAPTRRRGIRNTSGRQP